MICCAICGNQDGPWVFVEDIGFVCEDCEEDGKLEDAERKLQMRRSDKSD